MTLYDKKAKETTLVFCRCIFEENLEKESSDKAFQDEKKPKFRFDVSAMEQIGAYEYVIGYENGIRLFENLSTKGTFIDPLGHTVGSGSDLRYIDPVYCRFRPDPPALSCIAPCQREAYFLGQYEAGSYVVEFFDEKKDKLEKFYRPLDKGVLEQLTKHLVDFSVDLNSAPDALGNVVFQFPVRSIEVKSTLCKRENSAEFKLSKLSGFLRNTALEVLFVQGDAGEQSQFQHDRVLPYKTRSIKNYELKGNSFQFWVKRRDSGIVLFYQKYQVVNIIHIVASSGSGDPGKRIFETDGFRYEFEIYPQPKPPNVLSADYHKKISRERGLPNFISFNNDQKAEAFSYLRKLIGRNIGASEILLMDPYLETSDILNTLFFSTGIQQPLKALGIANKRREYTCMSTEGKDSELDQKTDRSVQHSTSNTYASSKILRERNVFFGIPEQAKNGLNIEFRMVFDGKGTAFHDRFLIFKGTTDGRVSSSAYSLGASLNQFGEVYHAVVKLDSAQSLIDDFERFWKSADHEECVVFKYPSASQPRFIWV